MKTFNIEFLESRRLLSVTVAESEPNTGPAGANPVPRVLGESVHFTGAIDAPGDLDWLTIDLQKGDVFGASQRGAPGLDGMIHFGNSAGELLMHNDDSFFNGTFRPAASPLPRYADDIRDPEVFYVVTAPGTYYLQLSAYTDPDTGDTSTGAYDLEIVVARPAMESKPVGAKQIIFLDFDGGTVPLAEGYVPQIDPLITTLSQWGLGPSDLKNVIRETVRRTTEKLSTFIAANGANGDYAKSGTPGEFGVDIRNSMDNPDPGADPLVSRITVGLTDNERLANDIGYAQLIDVGNFQLDDQAAVSTNFIAGLFAGFPLAKPGNKQMIIDFAAEYMSVLISHEFGHLAGAFHTQFTVENSFNGEAVNLMDKDIRVPLGPDLVFGTKDDITMHFGVDGYATNEIFVGINDTLNTVAFGLSTGTVRRHGGPGAISKSIVNSLNGSVARDKKEWDDNDDDKGSELARSAR
jgi:hypothetical protein